MAILEPYNFDKDSLDPQVSVHLIGTGNFEYQNIAYEYGIIHPDAAPSIPNFVGMPMGHNLFASQDIPKELLPHFLAHEIECNRLQFDTPGRCASIEKKILMTAPQEIARSLLINRYRMFDALVKLYKVDLDKPDGAFWTEVTGTTKYLRDVIKMSGLQSDVKRKAN